MARPLLLVGGFYHCTPAWGNPSTVNSNAHKLYFPRRGLAHVGVDGVETAIKPGHIYFIPGHHRIGQRCDRFMDVDWLHFRLDPMVLDLRLGRVDRIVSWPVAAWRFFAPTIRALDDFFRNRPGSLGYRVEALVMSVVAELMDRHVPDEDESATAKERFVSALALMDSKFRENPSLAVLAATVHLNPEYFHRAFVAAFQTTPFEYMLGKRMALADELLRETGLPIKEIARRCGYANQLYFSRVFAKRHGCSPRQLRERQQVP